MARSMREEAERSNHELKDRVQVRSRLLSCNLDSDDGACATIAEFVDVCSGGGVGCAHTLLTRMRAEAAMGVGGGHAETEMGVAVP